MRAIAIVNQKGGCGKTTVSINLASALAEAGQRTLLVDTDPQSHCAVGLAVPEEQIEQSIYDVLISKSRNEPIKLTEILWQINDRLQLAPASLDLSAFEQQMSGIPDRECCLRDVLDQIKNEYDYAIIDCPPAVGLLTFSALRAATDVIVPVETGYFALHGLSRQLETLTILCKRCNHQVNVRVLASMYDIRTKMGREILAELRKHFADRMFNTVVNFNTKIKEAASLGQPICEYNPASKGHKDFRSLAEEVMGLPAKQQRHEFVNSLASQLEAISATADELLQAGKTPIKAVPPTKTREPSFAAVQTLKSGTEPSPKEQPTDTFEKPSPLTTEAKLSDYYGVNQVNDAIVFVTLYPRASAVQIAGDFNNWQPEETPMQKIGNTGVWQTKLKLPAGKYRYRLVVDGQWQQDPYNEWTELNPYGDYNSVVEVK
ncbi:MAG: AAA family ATPase [Planctomycetota bacterium]|jgi:chromosome partitioning protein